MTEKTWNDQPDACEQAVVLSDFSIGDGYSVEVRKAQGVYYLTTGNLFGSQTLIATDADAMLSAIGKMASVTRTNGYSIEVPKGLALLSNAEDAS